jgi:drug/metabolite transporter (DMT)-like permease
VYAGSLIAAVYHSVDIILCALILSLQPPLTVLLSSTFLAEKITPQKIAGILAGFAGVSLIILQGNRHQIAPELSIGAAPAAAANSLHSLSLCFLALLAISVATVYQKHYCTKTEILPGACIQYTAAAIVMWPIAMSFETMQVESSIPFVLGMGWLVVMISLGAMSLLMLLIKRGAAGTVANLFYLVTPLVTIQAWLFDESITVVSLIGMALCMTGVIAVNRASTRVD